MKPMAPLRRHVLRTIGEKLGQRIRREELIARYTSDCFALILPDTTRRREEVC